MATFASPGTRKYLRVCGEERGRRQGTGGDPGNTSACAEKRIILVTGAQRFGKYLRVCGEERVLIVAR